MTLGPQSKDPPSYFRCPKWATRRIISKHKERHKRNFKSCLRNILIIFPWFSCSSNVRCVRRNYIVQQQNNKTAQCTAHTQRSNPNTHMTSRLRWRASRTCSNTYDNRQVTCWQRNSQLLAGLLTLCPLLAKFWLETLYFLGKYLFIMLFSLSQ